MGLNVTEVEQVIKRLDGPVSSTELTEIAAQLEAFNEYFETHRDEWQPTQPQHYSVEWRLPASLAAVRGEIARIRQQRRESVAESEQQPKEDEKLQEELINLHEIIRYMLAQRNKQNYIEVLNQPKELSLAA